MCHGCAIDVNCSFFPRDFGSRIVLQKLRFQKTLPFAKAMALENPTIAAAIAWSISARRDQASNPKTSARASYHAAQNTRISMQTHSNVPANFARPLETDCLSLSQLYEHLNAALGGKNKLRTGCLLSLCAFFRTRCKVEMRDELRRNGGTIPRPRLCANFWKS